MNCGGKIGADSNISEYCGRGKLLLIVLSVIFYVGMSNRDL